MHSITNHLKLRIARAQALTGWALGALWVMATALLFLIGRSSNPNRPMLRKLVRVLEHRLEATILLMAALRAAPPKRARDAGRAPRGFARRRFANSGMRAFMHGLGLRARGDLRTRVAHVLAVLAAPERYVAKLVKRLSRGLKRARIVPIAPPALVFASTEKGAANAAPNSS